MDDYCFMFTRYLLDPKNNKKLFGIDIDISTLYTLQNEIDNKEKEKQYILDNTSDLIAKVKPDGTVLFASDSFSRFFPLSMNEIIGNNIYEINKTVIIENNDWLSYTIQPPYASKGTSKIENGDSVKWVSWKNDAVFNNKGEIEYIVSIGHDITEIINLNEQLKNESIHDYLTGLLNRRGLFEQLSGINPNQRMVAIFIDIDNFNSINDYYGHEIGDQIIKLFSEKLKVLENKNCIISRQSGDEFIILSKDYSEENFNELKEILTCFIRNSYQVKEIKIMLNASAGYAIYPDDTNDINQLISYADLAMYESKKNKDGRCVRYKSFMSSNLDQKIVLANEIKNSIDNDGFEINFQPIIDVKKNKIIFLESLVRWHSKERGLVNPDVFLPIAKESGLIVILDLHLIEKTLVEFSQVKKMSEYKDCKLTINVSPLTLLKDNFPSILNELIIKYGMNHKEVCVEVSESTFVNNLQECFNQMHQLKSYGIIIAIDDFGREYSSLAILDDINFDIIKIDRLFIENIKSEKNMEIIKMIIKISSISGKKVVAEGVETCFQKDTLFSLGCYLQQGYFFSKPKKIDFR